MCRGFEPEWILPISLMSRTQGLLAHWKEAMCKLIFLSQMERQTDFLTSWYGSYLAPRPDLHRRSQQEDSIKTNHGTWGLGISRLIEMNTLCRSSFRTAQS